MNYITQARGTLLPIPAGVLHIETPTGVQPVPIVAGEMGETPVTMGQFKLGIQFLLPRLSGRSGSPPRGK